MVSRRHFLGGATALIGAGFVSRANAASIPEAQIVQHAHTMPPPAPPNGRPFNPVVTLNGWSAPWRMKSGWKEFHLIAEPVIRELAPGMKATLWGYNGSSPGPTIEVVEDDKVRIFVTNKLPEHTTIHWHGQRLPNGMDGVGGVTQPQIPPGKTYVYEFEAKRPGTFMYHPHADEVTQMAMGMMGFWVTHPKDPQQHRVDRDFVFLLNAYDIEPGSSTPRVNTMLDFNLWTWNSRVFPGIDPIVCRQGDRVRIRCGNLSMTNHPIHLHGHEFEVTGTDGGWVPPTARWPEVTTDVAVGQMRAIEFDATESGDWAFHCHKGHHTMNAMGHDVPTMIGVDQRRIAEKVVRIIPDYMAMGSKGMADMGTMQMPENTLPMMSGNGPFGPIEMGGMFTIVKIRPDQKPGDYSDPGWYRHPKGSVAYALNGKKE
ncbi:multicopper oxidase family protein [Oxalicibacterium solurbis]|uniref:Exported copper oxidase n=1 Tax=Oxalicibacterium solurbis TaxID=69280 RepID=A0A8J3F4T2_9BURK|nr:copper oxidase [Oxalicibacterium solurbis]GGI52828.1 exported copper oxidase [Oxalicibacterium solurbis]